MKEREIGVAWLYVLSKYGFPPDVEGTLRGLDDIARMGFSVCELESVGAENFQELRANRERIQRKLDEHDLKVANYIAVIPDLVSDDAARRMAARELFAEAAAFAATFGCGVIQSDSFLPPVEIIDNPLYEDDVHFERSTRIRVPRGFDWPGYWGVLVDTFQACADIASDQGLRLAIEPRVGETLSNSDALLRLIDHTGSADLGVVFDAAHLHAQRELLPLSIHKLAGRIFHVHIADNDGTTNRHAAPGSGTIDWAEVLQALDDVGYAGPLMLDIGKVPDIDRQVLDGRAFLTAMAERPRDAEVVRTKAPPGKRA